MKGRGEKREKQKGCGNMGWGHGVRPSWVKKSKPQLAQTDPREALRHVRPSHRSQLTYLLPALKATNSIKPTTLQVEDFIKTKKNKIAFVAEDFRDSSLL